MPAAAASEQLWEGEEFNSGYQAKQGRIGAATEEAACGRSSRSSSTVRQAVAAEPRGAYLLALVLPQPAQLQSVQYCPALKHSQ